MGTSCILERHLEVCRHILFYLLLTADSTLLDRGNVSLNR